MSKNYLRDIENATAALEGALCDPQETVEKLYAKLKAGLAAKNATVADCDELIEQLGAERVRFNERLSAMADAIRQFRAQDISAEQLKETVAPHCTELRKVCKTLGLTGEISESDDGDITDEEVAILKEFIAGSKAAVEEYRQALMDEPGEVEASDTDLDGEDDEEDDEDDDDEVEETAQESFLIKMMLPDPEPETATESSTGIFASLLGSCEVALEGVGDTQLAAGIRNGTKAKTAANMFKQAQKLHSMKQVDKAISTMERVGGMYEALAKEVAKIMRTKLVNRSAGAGASVSVGTGYGVKDDMSGLGVGVGVKSTVSGNVTDSYRTTAGSDAYMELVAYFEDRADAAKAFILKWKNKSEAGTIKDLKAQLKAERKSLLVEMRAAKKQAKADAKTAKAEAKAAKKAEIAKQSDIEDEEIAAYRAERKAAKEAKKNERLEAKAAKKAARATESYEDLTEDECEEMALEAALAVMMAEDGFEI